MLYRHPQAPWLTKFLRVLAVGPGFTGAQADGLARNASEIQAVGPGSTGAQAEASQRARFSGLTPKKKCCFFDRGLVLKQALGQKSGNQAEVIPLGEGQGAAIVQLLQL